MKHILTLLTAFVLSSCYVEEPLYPRDHVVCLETIAPIAMCEREYYWTAGYWDVGVWHPPRYVYRYSPPRRAPWHPRDHRRY